MEERIAEKAGALTAPLRKVHKQVAEQFGCQFHYHSAPDGGRSWFTAPPGADRRVLEAQIVHRLNVLIAASRLGEAS